MRRALARVGGVRACRSAGVALVGMAILGVLGERLLRLGPLGSLLALGAALAAAVVGVLLFGRSAPLSVPPGTAQDPTIVGEIALAAIRSGGGERAVFLDVCGALAYHSGATAIPWKDADLNALRALLSRCDPSDVDGARLVETTLRFFAVHGGARELELARWLSTGTGGSAIEVRTRSAAAECMAIMERRLADECRAGTLLRPTAQPADLLRPTGPPQGDGALLRPSAPDDTR